MNTTTAEQKKDDFTISLDDLLADAAQELRASDMNALSEAVQIARARLDGSADPLHDSIRAIPACSPDEIPFYAPPSDLDSLLRIGALAVQLANARQYSHSNVDSLEIEVANACEKSGLISRTTASEMVVLAGRSLVSTLVGIRARTFGINNGLSPETMLIIDDVHKMADGALRSVGVQS